MGSVSFVFLLFYFTHFELVRLKLFFSTDLFEK